MQVCHSFFAFSTHWLRSLLHLGFHFLIFQLTTSDHKASLSIKPFMHFFLKISLPLRRFWLRPPGLPYLLCLPARLACLVVPLARLFHSSCCSSSCLVKRFCFALAVNGELSDDVKRGTAPKKSCGSQLVPCASPCMALVTCTVFYNMC